MYFLQNHIDIIKSLIYLLCTPLFFTKFVASDSCWSGNTCNIHATYYTNATADIEISKILNCADGATTELLIDDFVSSKNVTLNGCNAPLNAPTYGMEYLKNCNDLIAVVIERFQTDTILQLNCSEAEQAIHLKYLNFQYNDVHFVTRKAFENLKNLQHLYFISNTLKYIEADAFVDLPSLRTLRIENELNFYLQSNSLLQHTNVAEIQFSTLKCINDALFRQLPQSLQSVHVSNTPFEHNKIQLENSLQLKLVRIINCSLVAFALDDKYSSVRQVNLSGNLIVELQLQPAALGIEILDLSYNRLEALPTEWNFTLPKLKQLFLSNNHLKVLSLASLLTLTTAKDAIIDLSANDLSSIEDITELHAYYEMRLKIDRNPWHCKWLIQFTDNHPYLLHLFQYDKYISRINVNGLECIADVAQPTAVPAVIAAPVTESANTDANLSIPHNSHYIIGGPWEVKRNQRAEALIIVFMLPLGISFLFLLLYLWIHCHKIFSLSYYQSIPKHEHSTGAEHAVEANALTTADAQPADGYEVPLNIDMPKYHAIQSDAYDLPTDDLAKKIYEDIYVVPIAK